jgi:hypothetical protein
MLVTFDRKALESVLIHVALPDCPVRYSKALAMRTRQILEELGQLFLIDRTYDEMPMIGHQLISIDRERRPLECGCHKGFKCGVLGIPEKQSPSVGSAIENVIDMSRFHPPRPGSHGRALLRNAE